MGRGRSVGRRATSRPARIAPSDRPTPICGLGEWLRRGAGASTRATSAHRPRDGHRDGCDAFAERAERELLATGERARKRTVETREDLTAQEAQIARLAGEGFSNPEIGARLLISPKTVE